MRACPPLLECIAPLPDPRQPRGVRHPLGAMVALAVAATLCGCRSYSAMAEWGRTHGAPISQALGFTRARTPCAATFYQLFRRLDWAVLEACLGAWVTQVLAALPAETPRRRPGAALDGKTLRGSRKQGASLTHLLAAVSHRLGLTLGQVAVPDKTNEITAIHPLLARLLLAGYVVTVDALLTQEAIAQAILDAQADYIMIVKKNQPTLLEALVTAFADPALLAEHPRTQARTIDRGHGRGEVRTLTLSSALLGYLDWPGHQQIFQLVRTRTHHRTGEVTKEIVYGLTSLAPAQADAAAVLARVRAHWTIENRSHWVRDVLYDEDRSQVRTGALPHVMTAFRNTAIALLRLHGEPNLAAATRRLAAHPWHALAHLHLPRPTIK